MPDFIKFLIAAPFVAAFIYGYLLVCNPPIGKPADAQWQHERPLWVRLALSQIASRRVAIFFMRMVIMMTIFFMLAGIIKPAAFLGGAILLLTSVWYWRAIKWADRYDAWPYGA